MVINHTTAEGVVYEYTENFWTGRKELKVNGEQAERVNREQFKLGEKTFLVKGSFLFGIQIYANGKPEIILKNKWYEWVLIAVPYGLIFIGAYLGGLIGGLLAGLFFATASIANATVLRTNINVILKVLIGVAAIAAAAIAWWLLYWELVMLIYA